MTNWQAWIAALGGLVALGEWFAPSQPWYATIGGLSAIIFGVWAAYAD